MSNEFNEENAQQIEHKKNWNNGNEQTLKFLAICLSAFLGGFIATCLMTCLIYKSIVHNPFVPKYYTPIKYNSEFKNMEKNANKMMDEMEKNFNKMSRNLDIETPFLPVVHSNFPVKIEELQDEYKAIIDLQSFNNDAKNLNIDIKPHSIKISSKTNSKKENSISNFTFNQEMRVSNKIDVDKVTKEQINNKFIITMPIDD